MNDQLQQTLLSITHASSIVKKDVIQSLWSGYGEISRFLTEDTTCRSIVIKHVKLPNNNSDSFNHPRGWNTALSHKRKITSYQVESAWYRDFSQRCDDHCRVPQCYGLAESDDEFLIILEDLDANGFPFRRGSASNNDMKVCLNWLAHFHATFLTYSPDHVATSAHNGLWTTGTYWHLDTRPDELKAMDESPLKQAANEIDQMLTACPYQTLVHGDAKLANFCFSESGQEVAAVDFQYVGGGCGMKDVAYFIGSCLDEEGCNRYSDSLLDYYFRCLKHAVAIRNRDLCPDAVESAWRPLFSVAWADFHRFLKGWSPDHWKIHRYSEQVTHQVLKQLGWL
jgi:thiamine kinase-like enzyme